MKCKNCQVSTEAKWEDTEGLCWNCNDNETIAKFYKAEVKLSDETRPKKYKLPTWSELLKASNYIPSNVMYFDVNEIYTFIEEIKPLTTLPTDSADRKNFPLFRGCLRYFAAALAGVARTSKLGNDKHNPGESMYHARGKSSDHGDCLIRHLMDVEDLKSALERGDVGITKQQVLDEVNQMAWRALAFSQELHEQLGTAPLAPGAKLPNG